MEGLETRVKWRELLYPAALLYGGAVFFRNLFYDKGGLSRYRLPVGCISVGNITWGGTGKTPVCIWLLHWLGNRGFSPLLLTRGYKGRASSYPLVVSSSHSPHICGDEPCMLLQDAPFAKIIVDPCRERGFEYGWRLFKPDIVILDDGFQYRRLKRDIDIVVFASSDLMEWDRLLPMGNWRERSASLERAHCFLINSTDKGLDILFDFVKKRLFPYNKPIFPFEVRASHILEIHSGEGFPRGFPYILVTGIGNPYRVEKTALRYLGYPPLDFLCYPDHHLYTLSDWKKIYSRAQSLGAKIICTPKDAIKLKYLVSSECYTFDLELRWLDTFFLSTEDFPLWLSRQSIFKEKSSHRDIGDQSNEGKVYNSR